MDKFNSQYATKKLREESVTSAGPGSANMTAGTGEQYATTKAFKKTKKNEIIKKVGDKYAVYPEKGGKRLGTHDSKEKAKKQLAAIEISKAQKEAVDKEPKLAAGEAENYVKDKWGWKEAPSIPNRPSKGGFIYKQLYEGEINENVNIPLNIVNFAKKKGISAELNMIANWVEKAGKRIVGGTAIGKNYNTLVLDLTHQGSEIYYNIDNGSMEVNGQPVDSYEEFLEAITVVDGSLNENYSRFKKEANETEWPSEISSRYGEYIFKLINVMSDGAKYDVIDAETGKKEPGGRAYRSVETLKNAAADLVKPKGGTQSTQLEENYSRFKKETKTRTNEQQLHTAMRLAEKKIREANRILEYTTQLRTELNETRMNKNTQKLMEKITRGIAEAYGKMKKLK